MKIVVLLFFSWFLLGASQKIDVAQKPQAALVELSKDHAIKVGTGTMTDVYVFLDPLCSFSKALMKQIDANKMLQVTNTYHILMYRLPRLDSDKMMQYILEAKDQKETLLAIMVDGEVPDLDGFVAKPETLQKLKEIAEVAKQLDMQLRPYMISFDRGSKYCRVSEGTASCLEELE
jgi:hypothetical protein